MTKHLTVARLTEILQTLPSDALVVANQVGNLIAFTVDDKYLGYIDFSGIGGFKSVDDMMTN